MDHVGYLDTKAKELDKLRAGEKTMIIRGAAGRKLPYGRVEAGDVLYFMNNNAEGLVRARGEVSSVLNSEKMPKEDPVQLVEDHQDKLQLTKRQFKRWGGKRYLVLSDVGEVAELSPFSIDKSNYGNMEDWLPVGSIEDAKL